MKIAATGGGQVDGENGEAVIDPDRYSPFFYLWILCSIASSLYAYTWDIKMDWGLLDRLVSILIFGKKVKRNFVLDSVGII